MDYFYLNNVYVVESEEGETFVDAFDGARVREIKAARHVLGESADFGADVISLPRHSFQRLQNVKSSGKICKLANELLKIPFHAQTKERRLLDLIC